MKKIRKIFIVALMAVLSLSLFACGGKGEKTKTYKLVLGEYIRLSSYQADKIDTNKIPEGTRLAVRIEPPLGKKVAGFFVNGKPSSLEGKKYDFSIEEDTTLKVTLDEMTTLDKLHEAVDAITRTRTINQDGKVEYPTHDSGDKLKYEAKYVGWTKSDDENFEKDSDGNVVVPKCVEVDQATGVATATLPTNKDHSVVLTIKVSLEENGQKVEIERELKYVVKKKMTDLEKFDEIIKNIKFKKIINKTFLDGEDKNIYTLKEFKNEQIPKDSYSLKWITSSEPSVISDNGETITLPTDKDLKVTLTLEVTIGTFKKTKEHEVSVFSDLTNEEKVTKTLEQIDTIFPNKEITTAGEFEIPEELPFLNLVTNWIESSNSDVIKVKDGKATVTLPTEDKTVELTIEIKLGEITKTQKITFTVKAS